jgi:tetratricopeptide (TPR) repeat protein
MIYRTRHLLTALLFVGAFGPALPAHAAGGEPVADPVHDPAPCLAAASAHDDDAIVGACGAVIEHDKTARPDRIKALIARGGAFANKQQPDRAIADYDAVLQLDPALPEIHYARGELLRGKGDRPRALADFAAALKLNPDHAEAKASHKALALELERQGALMAVAGKPSFSCAGARHPVEKAICANPELADLDRNIAAALDRVLREARDIAPKALRAQQREHADYLQRRNASFGRPGYDLRAAMKARLQELVGVDGY